MSAVPRLALSDEAKTLGSKTYDRLRDDVVAGLLAPGQKLTLDSLRERYAVGVTPLREALYRLTSSQLVLVEDQRGFRVAPVTVAHLEDITASRQHIETLVLRDAFRHGGESWSISVSEAFEQLRRTPMYTVADGPIAREWEVAHRNFHHAVLSAARSKALMHFQTMLWDHAARYRNIVAPGLLQESDLNAEHEALLNAICDRDEEMACLLLRRHITAAAEPVLRALAAAIVRNDISQHKTFEKI